MRVEEGVRKGLRRKKYEERMEDEMKKDPM
jgi:hypothetical protein